MTTNYIDNPKAFPAPGGDIYTREGWIPDPTPHATGGDSFYPATPYVEPPATAHGYTFYPDPSLANEAAHAQIFVADMLAYLLIAFLLFGAWLWVRDIARFVRARRLPKAPHTTTRDHDAKANSAT